MQLSYNLIQASAFEGMLADIGLRDVGSYISEESPVIAYGLGVIQGAADQGLLLPSADTNRLLGVLVHNQIKPSGIRSRDTADVLRKGRIWVLPEQDIAPKDPVFWRIRGDARGRFRKDADGGAAIAVANARWCTTGGTNQVAVLEINLPN